MRAGPILCAVAAVLSAPGANAQTWFADRSDDVTIAGIAFDDLRLEINCATSPELGPTGFAFFQPAGQPEGPVSFVVDRRATLEFEASAGGFEARTQEDFDRFARLLQDLRAGNRLRVVTSAGEHFLPLRGSSAALGPCPTDIIVAAAPLATEPASESVADADPTPEPAVEVATAPETPAPNPVGDVEGWLIVLGYDPEPVDGAADPALYQALAQWQRDTGREITGGLTAEHTAALRAQAIGAPTWVIDPPEDTPVLAAEPTEATEEYGRVTLADCAHRRGFGRLSYNRGVTSTQPNPTLLTDVCFDEAGGAFVAAETLDGLTPVPSADELRKFEILTGDPANRTEVSVGREAQSDCGVAEGEGFILATAPGDFALAQHPDAAWVVGEGYFLDTVAAPGEAKTYETAWVSIIPTSVDGAAFWTQFRTGFSGLSLWGAISVEAGAGEAALSGLGTDASAEETGTLSIAIDPDGHVEALGQATATQGTDVAPGEWQTAALEIGPLSGHSLDGGGRIIAFGPVSGTMTLDDGQTLEIKGDATLQACAKDAL